MQGINIKIKTVGPFATIRKRLKNRIHTQELQYKPMGRRDQGGRKKDKDSIHTVRSK